MCDRTGCENGPSAGFTLIEVLVSTAVIGVMVGALVPALSGARQMAWQMGSNSRQRELVSALLAYSSRSDEWIPGVNTSGLRLWDLRRESGITRSLSLRGDAPVQNTDWISPVIGEILPDDREHRFYWILDRLADPAMVLRVPVFRGGRAGNQQLADWIEEGGREAATGVSYLMPMNVQLLPGPHRRLPDRRWISVGQRNYAGGLLLRQTRLPRDYLPRLTRLGADSRKIALADGFRYLDSRSGVLDFDASYSPYRWGSFAERSPLDQHSRSYGRFGGGGDGENLPLVYRHRGRMDAAMWDGHVEMLTERESRNPALWTPSRSVFVGGTGTDPDAFEFGLEPSNSPLAPEAPSRSVIP